MQLKFVPTHIPKPHMQASSNTASRKGKPECFFLCLFSAQCSKCIGTATGTIMHDQHPLPPPPQINLILQFWEVDEYAYVQKAERYILALQGSGMERGEFLSLTETGALLRKTHPLSPRRDHYCSLQAILPQGLANSA